jgi:hypothetical protein
MSPVTLAALARASHIPGASIDLLHPDRHLAPLRLLIYIENKACR